MDGCRRNRFQRLCGVLALCTAGLAACGAEERSDSARESASLPALVGMNIDPRPFFGPGTPSASDLKSFGVGWVRIELKKVNTEGKPAASYAQVFDYYDGVIDHYLKGGIKVLLLVDYSSVPGYYIKDCQESCSYLEGTFRPALKEIAAHYRDRVSAWEIWNEPDLRWALDELGASTPFNEEPNSMHPQHLAALLEIAYSEIKRVAPSRPVIVGGLASGQPDYLRRVRAARQDQLFADGVGVHPYGQRVSGWPEGWGFGELSNLIAQYRVFQRPLWFTEFGTEALDIQAEYLTRFYRTTLRNFGRELIPVAFWYGWSLVMKGGFGILDAAGKEKPVAASLRELFD
jgi:hypothetical protein